MTNPNTGHGHVFPRPDGMVARCGGPGLCNECAADFVRKKHENKRKPSIEKYEHHGAQVFVRSNLKGKHREHCLCWSCEKLKPGEIDNCPIAMRVYQTCVAFNLVTPVYECPEFVESKR